jgi:hypothetical protein
MPWAGTSGEMPELAEGVRLEIACAGKTGTVGSNPTLSAMKTQSLWLCKFS